MRFRLDTRVLVQRRWVRLSSFTVLSHVGLFVVLLLAVRAVGVGEQQVTVSEVFAVFAFGRLLAALPITPGGLGVIELGYIGGLVAAGGNEPAIVAAVLVFRALTFALPIPIGAATYLVWRSKASWRPVSESTDLVR